MTKNQIKNGKNEENPQRLCLQNWIAIYKEMNLLEYDADDTAEIAYRWSMFATFCQDYFLLHVGGRLGVIYNNNEIMSQCVKRMHKQ